MFDSVSGTLVLIKNKKNVCSVPRGCLVELLNDRFLKLHCVLRVDLLNIREERYQHLTFSYLIEFNRVKSI